MLPGVGHITIVDDRKVTEDDCEDNFFVTKKHLGQPLAKVTQELLVEMNSDVSGDFVVADPKSFALDASLLSGYQLVVGTQLPESTALKLESSCYECGIPLVVRSQQFRMSMFLPMLFVGFRDEMIANEISSYVNSSSCLCTIPLACKDLRAYWLCSCVCSRPFSVGI